MRESAPDNSLEERAVVIYVKPGCHLCEEAERLLRELSAGDLFPLRTVNILDDGAIFERYRHRIPVVRCRGRILDEGRVSADRLRVALRTVLPLPGDSPIDGPR